MAGGTGGLTEYSEKLIFSPFSSMISPIFWSKFDQLKVEVIKLSEDPVPIFGFIGPTDIPDIDPILSVDNSSFESNPKPYFGSLKVPGLLINTNTVEQFRELDYNEVMRSTGQKLLSDLFTEDGRKRIADNPIVLASFYILTFADLKRCRFLFWFGYPAVTCSGLEFSLLQSQAASSDFKKFEEITKQLKTFEDATSKGFFIVEKEAGGDSYVVKSLSQISEDQSLKDTWFGFLDTCTIDKTPGWMLRNFLVFIVLRLNLSSESVINILSYRPGRSNTDRSRCYKVHIKHDTEFKENVKFIGWERNDKGNFGPKQVDLQASMDPKMLAETSADFNLKLMKWRVFPDFDLDMMHSTKCLIIGAGTLGCNVARCLMGWGIRNITFVDNGTVSLSNPVRQSLYFFADCENGGKDKACTAAENLKLVFPGMNTKFAKIMIPMAGHPTSEGTIAQTRKDYETLDKLIQDCDVMFLLMDTRESRWLPTVLGAQYKKIVINAALGFDSYVVMRHGMHSSETDKDDQKILGCYYCTDVVAPTDSTRDRTLDQQCTVTRPGVSMIAAALAVELLAAILHHPLKALAPSDPNDVDAASPLGFIPHTIRGFLSSGVQITPAFHSFDKCTACSPKVLDEISRRGFDFVLEVLNNSSDFLEKLTGLDKLKDANLSDEIIELSDEEDA